MKVDEKDLGSIFDVQWAPDDTSLAVATGRRISMILDAETGKVLAYLTGHSLTPKTVRYHPQYPCKFRDLFPCYVSSFSQQLLCDSYVCQWWGGLCDSDP